MRIALLTSFFSPENEYDGIARYVEDLAFALIERGIDVIVIAAGENSAEEEQRGDLKIYRVANCRCKRRNLFFPSFHYLLTSFKMNRLLKRLHSKTPFDIIEYPNTRFNGIISLLLGLPSPSPIYVERMSSPRAINPKTGFKTSLTTLLETWQSRHSDALISNSRANLKTCEKIYHIPNHVPTAVIPHGIPPKKIDPPMSHSENNKLTIFFLGRMNRRKGFDVLAEAWPLIAEQVPEAQLIVAGEDLPCEHGDSFFHWSIKDMPTYARNRIHYHGKVSSKLRDTLYQEAYICVMPSRYESFGLVILEAMQYGVPTISSEVGGIPEVIENGKTGLLVPIENVMALSQATIKLLTNQSLYNQIKTTMREKIKHQFSSERVAAQTIEFYRILKT